MITSLPTPPSTADSANFNVRANAFLGALPLFAGEANSLASDINDLLIDTQASAASALASAASALASQQAATASSNAIQWVSGTTYAIGDVRWSPSNYLAYRRKTAGAGTTDPSADATNWVQIVTLPVQTGAAGKVLRSDGVNATWGDTGLFRSARTTNTALAATDKGKLIDITSGTFTQTFSACAALGSGWFCYLKNSGTGDITLDPSGSELIDGLTSFVMYPGECRLVQCDGSVLRSVVLNSFYRVFTASGTFTKPPGYTAVEGLLWGGGGSGGRADGNYACGGGGGACAPFVLNQSQLSNTTSVTIGSGGTSVSTNSTSGNVGGNSTFGSLVTAYGGGGGGIAYYSASNFAVGGGGGGIMSAGTTGNYNSASGQGGAPGAGVFTSTTSYPVDNNFGGGAGGVYYDNYGFRSNAGNSVYGGAGGKTHTSNADTGQSVYGGGGGGYTGFGGNRGGGTSIYGGAGGTAETNSGNGNVPAGGGAGGSGAPSGAGARGELSIWGII